MIDGLLQGSEWLLAPDHVITYSLNRNDDGMGEIGPGGEWQQNWIDAIALAFTAWASVAALTFQQQPVDPNEIFFDSTADLALTLTGADLQSSFVALGIFPDPLFADALLAEGVLDRADYPEPEGDIAFDNFFEGFQDQYLAAGGWAFRTFIHEIGHALGLKHPDDDGFDGPGGEVGRPTFAELGIGGLDTPLWTLMNQNPAQPAATGFAATPMPLDIVAIQTIYGANMSYNTGDDIYSLMDDGIIKTIWDAGGNDTIDATGLLFGIALDLRPGTFTSHGASAVTAIAFNVTIENAIGTGFNDSITGNDAANLLDGRGGFDYMAGGLGDDTYLADQTNDFAFEAPGEGMDLVLSGASYYVLPANVENLILTSAAEIGVGNDEANVIVGDALLNYLVGMGGDDTLYGGDGGDFLFGGVYGFDQPGVSGNDQLYGEAGGDSLFSGDGDDLLDGGSGFDYMAGGPGNDTYVADERFDFAYELPGEGTDTVLSGDWYYALPANVENVTLSATGEIAVGNDDANVVTGNALVNNLLGMGGDDTLYGGDGGDFLFGGVYGFDQPGVSGNDQLYGEAGGDSLFSGDGDDLLDGGSGFDYMAGGPGNDTYVADERFDFAYELPGEGTDTIVSGAWYYALPANVENVTLSATGEIAVGNDDANVVTGNALVNNLLGMGGDDTLYGGDGDDFLFGGVYGFDQPGVSGNDQLYGEAGIDSLFAGDGDDTLNGGEGADYLVGGLGTDRFEFDALSEAGDYVADFDVTANEKVDLIDLLDALGYMGDDPVTDGYVRWQQAGPHTVVQIDADGAGVDFSFSTLVTLGSVTATELTLADHFLV